MHMPKLPSHEFRVILSLLTFPIAGVPVGATTVPMVFDVNAKSNADHAAIENHLLSVNSNPEKGGFRRDLPQPVGFPALGEQLCFRPLSDSQVFPLVLYSPKES